MNKTQRKTSIYLFTIILLPLLIGLILSTISFFYTYTEAELGNLKFCLSSSCIGHWSSVNKYPLTILAITGSIVAGLVTISGIIIALLNYQSSVRSSSIANHLSHLSLFSNYVYSETSRRIRISKSTIETMKWYNLIYADSLTGSLDISSAYKEFIAKLGNQISSSNKKYTSEENKDGAIYRYKDHQEAIILTLSEIGVYLERLPRIDFNEVEDQVLDLIRTVNSSFCRDRNIPSIPLRQYN